MKKVFKNRECIGIVIGVICLLIIIVPLFLLSLYSTPSADDFFNANKIINRMENGEGILKNIFSQSFGAYLSWQGTYFGDFLCYSNPMWIFKINSVPIISAFTVFCFLFVSWLLLNYIFTSILKQKKIIVLWSFIAWVLLSTQFMNPAENFYWYTGIAVYTGPFICGLFSVYCVIKSGRAISRKKKVIWFIGFQFFTFFCLGGALPLCTVSIVLVTGWLFYMLFLNQKKSIKFVLLVSGTVWCCSLLNILAPGNFVRQKVGVPEPSFSIFESLFWSFDSALKNITAQLSFLPLLSTCLLFFFFSIKCAQKVHFASYSPGYIALISFCAYAAGFFPFIYAFEGTFFPTRYVTILFYVFLILLFYNLLNLAGWLLSTKKIKAMSVNILCILSTTLFLMSFAQVGLGEYNSYNIVTGLVEGKVQYSYEESMRVLMEVQNSVTDNVEVLESEYVYPLLQPINLSTEDSQYWVNQAVAEYYEKSSVKLIKRK